MIRVKHVVAGGADPAEVIMPLGGFVVARGRLDFPLVVTAGFTGELLGALP